MSVVSLDLETHRIQDGLLAPPPVCAALTDGKTTVLRQFPEALLSIRDVIRNATLMVGANIAYDFGVLCATDPELVFDVFRAYDQGRVYDILIGQALDAIAGGHLFKDPRNGGPLRDPEKLGKNGAPKVSKRYSQAIVAELVLGRKDAKANDFWRERYAMLQNTALDYWPPEAKQYPKDDVEFAFNIREAQLAKQFRNLHNMLEQTRAAFALHLASVWGIRTDAAQVGRIKERVDAAHEKNVKLYTSAGILRDDGTENGARVAELVALAYGVDPLGECDVCAGKRKIPSPKTGKPINCKHCCGTGLDIHTVDGLLTDKGNIKTDRDTLSESGDELLEEYAYVSEDEKLRNTYLPFLETGTIVPINLRSNVLVETGRGSYDGLIQLIPRSGGIREAFIARPGTVFCSVDYSALELVTLSQVTLWLIGYSAMAQAINRGEDLHTKFAAAMNGLEYLDLLARVEAKDKRAKDMRQMAKAANFGFPGGMGAAKLVVTKRKEGLRFCITAGVAPRCDCGGDANCKRCYGRGALCGLRKVTTWKGNPCPPVCESCVLIAEDLRQKWLAQWPEMKAYFKWITDRTEGRGAGDIYQLVSRRLRGRCMFSQAANTLFQGLAADGAKHALWLVSKEAHTDWNSPLWGSHPLVFVHDEIFSEMPENIAHEAAWRQAEIQVAAMREYTPDVEVKAEPAIMRRWFKDAAAVNDKHGRLKPWWPANKKCKGPTAHVPDCGCWKYDDEQMWLDQAA